MASESDSDSDSDVAFAFIDFSGVNFDDKGSVSIEFSEVDRVALESERRILLDATNEQFEKVHKTANPLLSRIQSLGNLLAKGQYVEVLQSESANLVLGAREATPVGISVSEHVRDMLLSKCHSVASCVEAELVGVAALNLFIQLNYTGPSLDWGVTPELAQENKTKNIDPHPHLRGLLRLTTILDKPSPNPQSLEEKKQRATLSNSNKEYHNTVLSQLAVDGEWPCQVCQKPYFLLIARCILLTLAEPKRTDWSHSVGSEAPLDKNGEVSNKFVTFCEELSVAKLWSARAAVAHERLLQSTEPSTTLWAEVEDTYQTCLKAFFDNIDKKDHDLVHHYNKRTQAASIMLEWGLAQHHFDREGKGKHSFEKAMELSGLQVQVTGAEGKRTKYQQKSTAQMLVKATSAPPPDENIQANVNKDTHTNSEKIKGQMIEHDEEEILLENIEFEENENNTVDKLTVLDQSIILALCLDVKNTNPMDGLTAEQMGAYLARVLHHHNDWMIYSTALVERAWLECERTHGRERAILQLQALADQHSNRLTLTQSTFQSVEESASPQGRLKNIHLLVYPPRWSMLRDLAERYARMGIVTSAAEIFEELEMWDEVVECYRHAGKEMMAEKIVRARLEEDETPRMWAALGDLTNDPSYYEKALEVSNGRFSSAYVALGKYNFDHGNMKTASDYYKKALKIKPLSPAIWFRLGTVSMQLGEWETALKSFSEAVQQEPEDADAWANVAAVHLHNKNPAEAYPALIESLRQNRNNWRVWISKLYTCIDLQKYDEAIQACSILLDMRLKQSSSGGIPDLEERCVRAIVGGTLEAHHRSSGDSVATKSTLRTLNRVEDLLKRLSETLNNKSWVWETIAYFKGQVGSDEDVLDNLMKEYRSLQATRGWERDESHSRKMCSVVLQISQIRQQEATRESLSKSKYLIQGVIKKIQVDSDSSTSSTEFTALQNMLTDIENALHEV